MRNGERATKACQTQPKDKLRQKAIANFQWAGWLRSMTDAYKQPIQAFATVESNLNEPHHILESTIN